MLGNKACVCFAAREKKYQLKSLVLASYQLKSPVQNYQLICPPKNCRNPDYMTLSLLLSLSLSQSLSLFLSLFQSVFLFYPPPLSLSCAHSLSLSLSSSLKCSGILSRAVNLFDAKTYTKNLSELIYAESYFLRGDLIQASKLIRVLLEYTVHSTQM